MCAYDADHGIALRHCMKYAKVSRLESEGFDSIAIVISSFVLLLHTRWQAMRRRWLATFGIVEKEYRPPTAQERSDFKSLGFTDKDIDEYVKEREIYYSADLRALDV